MPVRPEVRELAALGVLPSEGDLLASNEDAIDRIEARLGAISPPLSLDEARALAGILGDDNCFGLAWTVVHLVETAGGWSLDQLPSSSSEFVRTLRTRLENAARLGANGVDG